LLAAEWFLTSTIPGTQFSQIDGKMAQAVVQRARGCRAQLIVPMRTGGPTLRTCGADKRRSAHAALSGRPLVSGLEQHYDQASRRRRRAQKFVALWQPRSR
jgi:hypothetical protein